MQHLSPISPLHKRRSSGDIIHNYHLCHNIPEVTCNWSIHSLEWCTYRKDWMTRLNLYYTAFYLFSYLSAALLATYARRIKSTPQGYTYGDQLQRAVIKPTAAGTHNTLHEYPPLNGNTISPYLLHYLQQAAM